jgi:hypothetical protein
MPLRTDPRALLAPAALLLLVGCHKASGAADGIKIEADIQPQPSASVRLKISDARSKPVTGARIELEGDMSHAGMAPVFGAASEREPGHYQGHLEFTMAGDWVVLLQVTLADGRVLERQVSVKGVRSH